MNDERWLSALLESLHAVLDKTDQLFLSAIANTPRWNDKDDRDPVSETDLSIENLIRELLHDLLPEVPFVGEETGGRVPETGLSWIVDPVDGTVNFLEGIPLCGTSIGLACDNRPILGAVSLPLLKSRFSGGPMVPSTENARRITVSNTFSLRQAVVAVGDYSTGRDAESKNERKLAVHASLAPSVYRIRMLGSAAIDLAWLASGRLHGSLTMSNNVWDMCGGVAIALGAGAEVSDMIGEPYTLASSATIAAVPGLLHPLLEQINRIDR
ncbi:inositol monophosphatase family protein (plasmid) [Mycolicibacterium aichiense]|uniref:inositol monophosphatase family protein n=1 Tax=Mycolicibacterium aichiense TaxID=1799 RepID=UPI003D67C3AC